MHAHVSGKGGGIDVWSGVVSLVSSTVHSNTAATGSNVYVRGAGSLCTFATSLYGVVGTVSSCQAPPPALPSPPAPPPALPPSPPSAPPLSCSNPCAGATCADAKALDCDHLRVLGCECDGCCTTHQDLPVNPILLVTNQTCGEGTAWDEATSSCQVNVQVVTPQTCGEGTAWDETTSSCQIVCTTYDAQGRRLQNAGLQGAGSQDKGVQYSGEQHFGEPTSM